VRRHATRDQAREFTPEDMRGWYLPDDRLGVPGEQLVTASAALEDTVQRVVAFVAEPLPGPVQNGVDL
jgi:hypothetical protein